jgi:hypothetical protein
MTWERSNTVGEGAIRIVGGDVASDRWLLTTAIGGDYFQRWSSHVEPSWRRYAEEHGLGIAVVTEDLFRGEEPALNGAWQKMLAPRELRHVLARDVRCALLDTDLFVAAGAASVFDEVPKGQIAVVSETRNLPLPIGQLRNRIALLRHHFLDPDFPLNSILNATPEQVFEWAGLTPFDDYFCAGMFIVDTEHHAEALAEAYRTAPQGDDYHGIGSWEEVWLNHWVQSRRDVTWLDYRWHALWILEVAAHYPFLYAKEASEELARWCLGASLLRNEFVHLAGRWESALLGDAFAEFPGVEDVPGFMDEVRRHQRSPSEAVQRGRLLPPD